MMKTLADLSGRLKRRAEAAKAAGDSELVIELTAARYAVDAAQCLKGVMQGIEHVYEELDKLDV